MARLDRIKENNIVPFRPRPPRAHWLTIVNTILILGLYFILLGK